MSGESSTEVDTSPSIQNTSEDRVLAFGFHAPSVPRQMATTILQEVAVEHELAQGGDADMYQAQIFVGASSNLSGKDSSSPAPGGGGPLGRGVGQPYPRGGFYPGPPGGPPGGGGGPPGSGNAGANTNPTP